MIGRQVTVALRRPLHARLRTIAAPQPHLNLAIRTFTHAPRLLDPVGRPKKAVGEPSRPVKRAVKSAAKKPISADKKDAAVQKLAERKRATKEREQLKKEKTKQAAAAKKSPEAIEKKKKALLAAETKDLKKAALSPPPTQVASNAWLQFLKSRGPELKETLGNRPTLDNGKREDPAVSVGQWTKKLSAAFKQLTPGDLEHWNHLAHTTKEAALAEHKRWVESHSAEEIRFANVARKQLRRRENKPKQRRTKWHDIVDERQPKRGLTPYLFFVTSRSASGDFKNITISDRAPLLSQEWRTLSEDERAKYQKLADEDKARYLSETNSTADSSAASDA